MIEACHLTQKGDLHDNLKRNINDRVEKIFKAPHSADTTAVRIFAQHFSLSLFVNAQLR